jgi:hypothetical protein
LSRLVQESACFNICLQQFASLRSAVFKQLI